MSDSIPIHPAANIFPMMAAAELQQLADDIRANGQREWVELYQGKVIDGRNRLKACELAGVEPEVVDIEEEIDPVTYVLSKNLHRRHLNESQRAMIGAEAKELQAVAAKERQRLSKGRGNKGPALAPDLKGEARAKAAALVGVSPRMISSAARVKSEGAPELYGAVRSGQLSVTVAEKFVRAVPDVAEQQAIISSELRPEAPSRRNDSRIKSVLSYRSDGRTPPAPKSPIQREGEDWAWIQLRAAIRSLHAAAEIVSEHGTGEITDWWDRNGQHFVKDFQEAREAFLNIADVIWIKAPQPQEKVEVAT